MVISRTDIIGLWNAVSVFYVKCEVDSCSAKRQFNYWPPDNSVVVPWLSSWPRTKIGVQNLLECLPLVSVYLRPSFIVTGIAHVFIQWMADSPAADSALKFINVLTGAASERYICKLHARPSWRFGCTMGWTSFSIWYQWIDDICKWPTVEFDHHLSCEDSRGLIYPWGNESF